MTGESVVSAVGSPPLFAFIGSALCLGVALFVVRRSGDDSPADRYSVLFVAMVTAAVVLLMGCLLTPVSDALEATGQERASVSLGRPTPWLWSLVVGIGMACLVLRRVGGTLVVGKIVREAERAPASLRDVFYDCCEDLRCHRPVLLRVSPDASGPFVTGLFAPVIVVPTELLDRSRSDQAHVLRHELAHFVRRDTVTQMATQVAGMLLWWNPLYWAVSREMNLLRELACDDAATFGRRDRMDYTRLLRYYAESASWNRALGFSQVRMATPGTLDRRLAVLERREPLATTLLVCLPKYASRLDVIAVCAIYAVILGASDLFVLSLDYEGTPVDETLVWSQSSNGDADSTTIDHPDRP